MNRSHKPNGKNSSINHLTYCPISNKWNNRGRSCILILGATTPCEGLGSPADCVDFTGLYSPIYWLVWEYQGKLAIQQFSGVAHTHHVSLNATVTMQPRPRTAQQCCNPESQPIPGGCFERSRWSIHWRKSIPTAHVDCNYCLHKTQQPDMNGLAPGTHTHTNIVGSYKLQSPSRQVGSTHWVDKRNGSYLNGRSYFTWCPELTWCRIWSQGWFMLPG